MPVFCTFFPSGWSKHIDDEKIQPLLADLTVTKLWPHFKGHVTSTKPRGASVYKHRMDLSICSDITTHICTTSLKHEIQCRHTLNLMIIIIQHTLEKQKIITLVKTNSPHGATLIPAKPYIVEDDFIWDFVVFMSVQAPHSVRLAPFHPLFAPHQYRSRDDTSLFYKPGSVMGEGKIISREWIGIFRKGLKYCTAEKILYQSD